MWTRTVHPHPRATEFGIFFPQLINVFVSLGCVHSFIEGCAEYELTLPQLPYVPNLATYVFLWFKCHLLTQRPFMKAILVVGGFGMAFFFSPCEPYLFCLPHSLCYRYVNLYAKVQLWPQLNTWHEVYVARSSVEFLQLYHFLTHLFLQD